MENKQGGLRSQRDKQMAAYLKSIGDERTRGVCALCYRSIAVDSARSTYRHICPGGRL